MARSRKGKHHKGLAHHIAAFKKMKKHGKHTKKARRRHKK